ncbi:EF-hand domain-containing protein [Defluviimonas salinarum]|uniref:Calcium-binding protein n=1 Tax=Defluviimonas salinarum TaxID=2992147 RepID=A0ABT3J5Z5_9RHOB|nr:calcium-binding protein [Defluviimonas salinarum]MCW3782875.1 calcium-binding protein [Defluviimonas salinarum]
MKRRSLLAIVLIASTIAAGFANAQGAGDDSGHFPGQGMMMQPGGFGMMGGQGAAGGMAGMGQMGDMMQMMRMHGPMMGGGMMGGMGMPSDMMGPMGFGMIGGQFAEGFDADGNGTVSSAELRGGLEARLTQYDADGDGSLSLTEFETLHAAMIRNLMVDHFQALDEDGDGAITRTEMTAPADRMQRMEILRSRVQGGSGGQTPEGQGSGGMMMDGN